MSRSAQMWASGDKTLDALAGCMQVVHGDMKSQNVLLSRNWDIAKIADAGVARFAKAVDVDR